MNIARKVFICIRLLGVLSVAVVFLCNPIFGFIVMGQTGSSTNTRFVFASDLNTTLEFNSLEIYTIGGDGSNLTQLTQNSFYDDEPTWAPDGAHIAFTSNRDGNIEVYVMDMNGSSPHRITSTGGTSSTPEWSPDGTQIAFTSLLNNNYEIYVVNSDGSGLSNLSNNEALDAFPTWSPDGSEIAFVSNRDGDNEIYIMNVDGSNVRQITNDGNYLYPKWSPNGEQIAFLSWRTGQQEIYLLSLGTLTEERITDERGNEISGYNWSQDSEDIVFSVYRGTFPQLVIINIDTQTQFQVTNLPAHNTRPDWQASECTPPPGSPTITVAPNDVLDLIAAIDSANANGDPDLINLSPGTYTLSTVEDNIDGPNGLPVITTPITIHGGNCATITREASAPEFRLFRVAAGGSLTLSDITLTDGSSGEGFSGGLIANSGALTVTNSPLTVSRSRKRQ